MDETEESRCISVEDAEEEGIGGHGQYQLAREPPRTAFSRQQRQPSPTVKLISMAVLAIATGAAVFALSSRSRSNKEYVEAWRSGMEEETPMEHVPFPEEGRLETEWQKHSQQPQDPLQAALREAEEGMIQHEQEQAKLAEAIKLGMANPPPPPSPPAMTREDWEKQVAQEEHLKRQAKFLAVRQKLTNRYWLQGDWYWKYSRDFRTPLENPKMPQCFRNATERGADFWVPAPVKHVQAKHHLPIYDVPHYTSRKAECFMGRKTVRSFPLHPPPSHRHHPSIHPSIHACIHPSAQELRLPCTHRMRRRATVSTHVGATSGIRFSRNTGRGRSARCDPFKMRC
mmetsp:Transcript_22301/g.61867  ORF Transcript_22301/g.61867 Transcript_22301/m.61867 type:complete len:342 (+) Transcript_22301:192-1217(+)